MKRRKLLFLTLVLSFITLINYLLVLTAAPIQIIQRDTGELLKILNSTPYLWRNPNNEEESLVAKITAQRQWIVDIHQTKYILDSPRKTIAVASNMDLLYETEGRLKCPYAKSFEDKCSIVRTYAFADLFRSLTVDAEVVVRNWEDWNWNFKLPKNVVQVMYILEPPTIVQDADLGKNDALLASYTSKSDIPLSYGIWRTNSDQLNLKSKFQFNGELNFQRNKTHLVAAIVSNCDSKMRLTYINELSNHIDVHLYGKCGTYQCSKEDKVGCLKKIGAKYKFFLSFENSNCENYITEKYFFNALMSGMVPIVMGASKASYDALGPAGAYIHVSDFKSPKELAEYLHYLDDEPEEYMKYFSWRNHGYISQDTLEDFLCRLCGLLYYEDFVQKPSWNNSSLTFKDVNKCLPGYSWEWE